MHRPEESGYDGRANGFVRGGMRRIRLIALSAIAAAMGAYLVRAADDVQRLADLSIRRLDLQTDFPRVPEPASFRLQLPSEVLWVVILVALAILLYAFRDMIPIFNLGRRGAWTEAEGEFGEAGSRTPGLTLGQADDLAARGRFVDAMHTLLLQSLAYIRERLNEQFADSLTSREILSSAQLPPEGRTSLRDIVSRVEWTYFGERPATRADYEACRASFAALAQALRGSARA
jgi:hypothetical protein